MDNELKEYLDKIARNMATKSDLKKLENIVATKTDIVNARKESAADIKELKQEVHGKFGQIFDNFKEMKNDLKGLQYFIDRLEKTIGKNHINLFHYIDGIDRELSEPRHYSEMHVKSGVGV